MAKDSTGNPTITGNVELPPGVDPADVTVEVHDKNGKVISSGTVDKQGKFQVAVTTPAATTEALAAAHPKVSSWFGLRAAEEKLAAATGDAIKAAKDDVDKLRDHVADFVASAPHLAAHAEGRPPDDAHDATVTVSHSGTSATHSIKLHEDGVHVGDLATPPSAAADTTDADVWKYDPNDPMPRRLWGTQTLDKPIFDDKWQAAYLKMLVYTTAPGRTRPYGSYVANFLEKSELKPYWSYQLDLLTNPITSTIFKTPEDAQAAFPKNKSIEAKAAGQKFVTDAYLTGRLLQGIYSPYFQSQTKDGVETLTATFAWGAYGRDGPYKLNDTSVELTRKTGTGTPTLASITVAGTNYTPSGDGRDWSTWNWAKYQLMISFLLGGETDMHLARGHLVVEQYQIPAMIHLSADNPIMQILAPQIRDVWGINNFGNPLIFGVTGVLAKCSALSHDGVHGRLQDELAGLDWRGFHPRAPLCADHAFAKAGNIVWDAAGKYVDGWLNKTWDKASAADAKKWQAELQAFASDLVTHAVPYKPTRTGDGWRDTQEFAPAKNPDGSAKTKSVSPLDPTSRDDLLQMCTYVIYHATFIHDWANDRQQDDGGDLLFASFGLQDDKPATGDWGAWWDQAKPLVPAAAFQLFLAQVLTNIRWGYVLGAPAMQTAESRDHEDHDEEPQIKAFLAQLEPQSAALSACGLDLDNLRARINT